MGEWWRWTRSAADYVRRSLDRRFWRAWILLAAILSYTIVFSLYVVDKYNDYRTGYFDFGNAIQMVWLASQGHITAYVYDRPIMLLPAALTLLAPAPVVLAVIEAAALGIGALPVYLIAIHFLKNRNYSLGFALTYLIYPPLTGINQYEFHDLSLCVPFLLFLVYFYLIRSRTGFVVAAVLALSTTEYAVVIVAFFALTILWEYFTTGRPRQLLPYVALSAGLAAVWVAYLQSVVLVPTYTLSTASNQAYTLTGSTSFLNPFAALMDPGYSLNYELQAKLVYLLLVFGPFLLLSFLAPRWLLPGLPWLLVVLFYSPLIATGGVGRVYHVWSQWSSFIVPFVIVSAIVGFSVYCPSKPSRIPRIRRPRATLAAISVVVTIAVVTTGAFSPFLAQSVLSQGDNLVPTDVPSGSIAHGVWPSPIPNTGTIDQYVAMVPASDSVLTQNVIGSKMAERAAPIYIFAQPGYAPVFPNAILVDTQVAGYCAPCLNQILTNGTYTLYSSDASAGLSLYFGGP